MNIRVTGETRKQSKTERSDNRKILPLLTGLMLACAAGAAPGDILYSNDFETEKPSCGFKAAPGEGRHGSTAWVAEAPITNDWQIQIRWPMPKAKPGMTLRGEFRFKATTNAAHYAAGPFPCLDIIWSGPGFSQDISESIRWLHVMRTGEFAKLEPDDEGWYKMTVEVAAPVEGNADNGPTLCMGMRWNKVHCTQPGKVWFDDVVVRETGRVWTGVLGTDAYRDEAAEGTFTVAASHYVDAESLRKRTYELCFAHKDAQGRDVTDVIPNPTLDVVRRTFDVAELPMGASEIALIVRDAKTKATMGRSALTFTRTAQERARRVRIDRFGRTLLDGRLFFPIGCFCFDNPGDLDRYVEPGVFNCIHTYNQFMSPEILDRYQALGLLVVATVKDHFPPEVTPWAKRKIVTEAEGQAWTEEIVNRCKSHPALLAWMSCDEFPVRVAPYLRNKYELIKKIDPDHPVFVCVCHPTSMRAFQNACDAYGTDCYPINGEEPDKGPARRTGNMLAEAFLSGMQLKGRALWQVPQMYSSRWEWGREAWKRPDVMKLRTPTFHELRSMVWQQIAVGANAVLFYSYSSLAGSERGTPEFERDFNNLAGVAREVKRFAPVLLREPGPALPVKDPANVRVRTWKADTPDSFYVLASNPTFTEYAGEIVLPPGVCRIRESLIPCRGVKTEGAKLRLALEPWDVALIRVGK